MHHFSGFFGVWLAIFSCMWRLATTPYVAFKKFVTMVGRSASAIPRSFDQLTRTASLKHLWEWFWNFPPFGARRIYHIAWKLMTCVYCWIYYKLLVCVSKLTDVEYVILLWVRGSLPDMLVLPNIFTMLTLNRCFSQVFPKCPDHLRQILSQVTDGRRWS